MKRILLFCSLALLAFSAPALASPYDFGPDAFDTGQSLRNNVYSWADSKGVGLTAAAKPEHNSEITISMLGFNKPGVAVAGNFGDYFPILTDSRKLAELWNDPEQNKNNILNSEYFFLPSKGSMGHWEVKNLGCEYAVLEDDLLYQPAGAYDPFYLEAGDTLIMSSFILDGELIKTLFVMRINPQAVPGPAALLLFGSGLTGLAVLRQKIS